MSPVLATTSEAQSDVQSEMIVDADPVLRAFYRMLDEAFGEANWHPNEDVTYAGELGFRPVDVVAPVEQHEALYERASAIETRMRREHGARVLIFVIEKPE